MRWHLNHERFGDKPWAVQAEALRRSEGKSHYGWFVEQGLGKSATALNEFVELNERGAVDGMLVIAPNSFRKDWSLLPEEWGAGFIEASTWPAPVLKTPFLYSVNFEAVRSGRGRATMTALLDSFRIFLVIDESSAIKHPTTQTTKAVIDLAKRAAIVRELNGTPMTQSVLDYWAQLRVLRELPGVNPFAFRNKFAVMGGFQGRQIKGMKNEQELYEILDRCSFRALKKDWRKDLPAQIDVPVHLEMTKRQQKHYSQMMEEFFTEINGVEVSADMVLTQMGKLRQISSCLAMQDGSSSFFETPAMNPKMNSVLDIIRNGPGKVIVVYVYKATGDMLLQTLEQHGLHPARLQGQMKSDDILEEKKRFNDDPACRVLVAQETAAHLGHTLLGGPGEDRCNRMIFAENSFSLKERLQMRDRIHRGEQDQDCVYFDLITSPMDQVVVNALQGKKALADSVDEVVAVVRRHGR